MSLLRVLGGMSDILQRDFGGPIEEKVSGLEGCHVAFEVRLRRDERLGVGHVRDLRHGDCRFRWPYRREGLRFRRLPRGV